MSYSASTPSPISKDSLLEQLQTLGSPQTWPEGIGPTYDETIDVVRQAVVALAAVTGQPSDLITVSISGHVNLDHTVVNVAEEFISIRIAAPARQVPASIDESPADPAD